ncbi:MAG: tetratricopeptide repeat protein [Luteitalea sp.]|nr:tetratricopeptide repeat protein [Luteitalea sp.]
MRRDRDMEHTLVAGLWVLLALLVAGCASDVEHASSADADATSPGGGTLRAVALPDMSRIEEPVQGQLSEQFKVLTQKRETTGTPPLEVAHAYGEMGKLLMAAKYFDLAEPYFLNAHTLAPREHRWPYYLGHLYRTKGALESASAFFERAMEQRPDDVPTLIWLGDVHLLEGRPAEAAPLFSRAAAAQPQNLAARFGLGRAALAQDDFLGAVAHFEGVLALNAQAVNVHYPLALAYRGLGETAKAEAHLRQRGASELLPADPLMEELLELLQSAIAYEIRGTRALNGADWSTAAAQFRQGLALEPSNPTLRHKLGTALYQLGEVRGAEDAFEEVVQKSPEYARAHYSLGVLLEEGGRYQEAIARYSTAVAREPGYVEARVRLAELLRRSGSSRAALPHYEHVLAIDPRISEAAFGHAMALVSLRRYQEAVERLRAAALIHPDEPVFSHALARILAAAPDDRVRDGRQALAVMQAMSEPQQRLDLGEAMAMVLAEVGRYGEATAWQRGAIAAADQMGDTDLAERMAGNLRLYEAGRPVRTPWREEDMP